MERIPANIDAHCGERLLAVRNDLGLVSEEYDPSAKRLVGNFPQAFSHIALINQVLAAETLSALA